MDSEVILQRAEQLGFPMVQCAGGTVLAGEKSWREDFPGISSWQFIRIADELDRIENGRTLQRLAAEDEQRTERRLEADGPDAAPAGTRQMFEDARERAARAETVEGKLDQLIALTERLVTGIEALEVRSRS